MTQLLNRLANLFPLWVLAGSATALFYPTAFTWFSGQYIVWGLAIIMIGMGIPLTVEDLRRVTKLPKPVITGVIAQFAIMPFLGWAIAHFMQLDTAFAVGLILVACCPGGTASNVVTYIAKANIALSVLMTMCSTFAAAICTPMLTEFYAGTYVPVDTWSLFLNTIKVVILPVALGVSLNHCFPKSVKKINPIAPLVSVIFIALICASIVGSNNQAVKEAALQLFTAVALLHLGGFGLGYLLGHLLGYDKIICRTISIEVGMQNSGLGAVLARTSFPTLPLAAVPAAISATFHSIIGSILAAYWRRNDSTPDKS